MNGDIIHQFGDGNTAKAVHSGSGDIVTGGKHAGRAEADRPEAIDTLVREIQLLRQHLDEGDLAVVDASVEELASNPTSGRRRILLQQITGIATFVGEVGAPVIAAIRALIGSA